MQPAVRREHVQILSRSIETTLNEFKTCRWCEGTVQLGGVYIHIYEESPIAMFPKFPLCCTFAALILLGALAHAENGEGQMATLSPDQIVQLLKDRAKPFDNVKIVSELSGREVIPPMFMSRGLLQGKVLPGAEIEYEARGTLMMRGTEITFERENIS